MAAVNRVAAAYGSIPATSRINKIINTPQVSAHTIEGLKHNNGNSLKLIGLSKVLNRNGKLMGGHPQFGIGYYGSEYDGYRRVTTAEWTNPVFQDALVQAHQEGGGWALLEKPLVCSDVLHVNEGWAILDSAGIVEIDHEDLVPKSLQSVYSAMNEFSEVSWKTHPPKLGNNWSVNNQNKINTNVPCLFVRDAAAPGGGSRRSRRHKRNKRDKKQKKRTRKH